MSGSSMGKVAIILVGLASIASCKSAEKVDHANFTPSRQVIFSRSDDGEVLLPAVKPFVGGGGGNQEPITESANTINNYYAKPSYNQGGEQPVCLLRTCEQTITGRDLTYQRALEIVQSEEYLVAVDADLIRRRQDDGNDNRLRNLKKLQEILAALDSNSRQVREAVYDEDVSNAREAKMFKIDTPIAPEAKLYNFTTSPFSYDWPTVATAETYYRLALASGLLIAAAYNTPAPRAPIYPINFPSLVKNKADDDDDEVFQVIPDIKRQGLLNPWKISEKQLSKRINIFNPLEFMMGKSRKNQRKNQQKRQNPSPPSNNPSAATEVPQFNHTKMATLKPKQEPQKVLGDPESLQEIPFLSDTDFKKFFPSWSRKRRATTLAEPKIFNSTGFGTVSYPSSSVLDTYVRYALVGGLFVAAAAVFNEPKKAFEKSFSPFKNNDVNNVALPPNFPPGGVPPGNPQPGTPGGGAKPVGTSIQAQQALALAPPGTIPVSIFPPYASPRTVPAISVIFLQTPTPSLVKRQGSIWSGLTDLARNYKCLLRKKRQTSYGAPSYNAPGCDYDNLRYGFRTRVTLVENQSCILGVTCTATGDKINVAALSRIFTTNSQILQKRQSGEEFRSDAPPECRAIRDIGSTCLNYY